MVVKVNWTKTVIASGLFAATAVFLYYLFKNDDEEPEEFDSYKQSHTPPALSTTRAEKISKKECIELLKKIADSQDETKALMATVVDELLSKKLKSSLIDVYQRCCASIPPDPLESEGLTLFDLDHVVDRYQNDPAIRDSIVKIMTIVPPEDGDPVLSIEEIIRIHEFMLSELEGIVASYKSLPNRESLEKKVLTLAVQTLISSRVQQKFGYKYTLVDKSVIKNHSELSMNTRFARLNMQMQSEMSEMTG
ncbi:hypothetical protein MACJ_003134 [Theileria orientalis]|uniref:Uncharacterized protein n=1 Tax=Theileria orientalis TaxID=68886 RepID=A0A976QRX6_THEOR|nr:hypothetical protein MACJ_003134 [Theileria orientalis]